jgi:large subunit ribosomal protein L4
MANARSGNRAQKDRRTVHHSTKKPWRQKGTGRARSGMTSSPIWRGGGRAFPNSPDENFTQKINRKMYRAGIAAILSKLVSEGSLSVVDTLTVEAPKTKLLANKLKAMGFSDRVLIVTDNLDDDLWMASRNLPNVMIVEPRHIDPVSMVRFGRVLMTSAAVKAVEEMLA